MSSPDAVTAGGTPPRPRRVRTIVAESLLLAMGLLLVLPGIVAAAAPTATAGIGDPRSPGQGPGLVGDPLTAILVVAAIGVVTVGITLAYVRLTARKDG